MPAGNAVREFGAAALIATGLPRFWHRHAHKQQVAILMYHAVVERPLAVADWCFLGQDAFRRQVAYLKKHFQLLPLSKAVEALQTGPGDLPVAVLTFDDGFQNFYDHAYPVLLDYSVPATLFLTTGLLDSHDTLWFCRLNAALASTQKDSLNWQGVSLSLATASDKAHASSLLQTMLKEHPPAILQSCLSQICQKLGVDPDAAFTEGSPQQMLRSFAIREMVRSGLVELGAHTHRHAILSQVSWQEQQQEIETSIRIIRELTGEPCTLFAYPNGRKQDYNDYTLNLLRQSGIEAAVTTVAGPNDESTPLLELRRYPVGANTSLAMLQLMAHHFIY